MNLKDWVVWAFLILLALLVAEGALVVLALEDLETTLRLIDVAATGP